MWKEEEDMCEMLGPPTRTGRKEEGSVPRAQSKQASIRRKRKGPEEARSFAKRGRKCKKPRQAAR